MSHSFKDIEKVYFDNGEAGKIGNAYIYNMSFNQTYSNSSSTLRINAISEDGNYASVPSPNFKNIYVVKIGSSIIFRGFILSKEVSTSENEKTVSMGQVHSNPYASSFKSQQQIKEDGHTDVPSAIRKLKTSIEDCQDILKKLEGMEEESLPSWWTDKITLASNYLNKARDYLLNTEET